MQFDRATLLVSTKGAPSGPLARPALSTHPSPVYTYQVYGQVLRSDLPFPELREATTASEAWTFSRGPEVDPPGVPDALLLGAQPIYDGCAARLYADARGWWVVIDDTGVFELAASGGCITWFPFPGSSLDFGRAHLLGRVLSTAMHFGGHLVLHGSAVSFPSGAVAFMAPKHSGKSTLALALTRAGARLMTDDTIPVAFEGLARPELWPGVHSLRLLPDSLRELGAAPGRELEDGKGLVTDLPEGSLETAARPLRAVYLLAAAESIEGGHAVARRAMAPPEAAVALVGQGKISEMLGSGQAPVQLRRAASLASQVPVYRLAVVRDFSRLSEVAARIAGWHAG